MIRSAALIFFSALVAAAQVDPDYVIPKENPHASPDDLQRGQRLFLGHCASCHGPAGEGGRGASLARPRLPRAPDDPALFKVIRDGLPGTEMPAAWVMINREIWQVAAYVRTLGRVAEERLSGDGGRGEAIYRGKGNCVQCHSITGHGGAFGPELTEIGSRRSATYLRAALLEPDSAVPEGFLQVRLTARDGRRLTAIRLNEDTFTIQIRDLASGILSFRKQDLKELLKDWGKSPMPGVRGALSDAEVADLVAYLAFLRGAK